MHHVSFPLSLSSARSRHLQSSAVDADAVHETVLGYIGDKLDALSGGQIIVLVTDSDVSVQVLRHCDEIFAKVNGLLADLLDVLQDKTGLSYHVSQPPVCGHSVVEPPREPAAPPQGPSPPQEPPPPPPSPNLGPLAAVPDMGGDG